ncbi:MAG: hemerythrin domain-containing protein [Actinomycetota bacterium]|nr:hemerythrin domain-containing protein [Actinomycetota bacterium]
MDGLRLLEQDHQKVTELFEEFEQAGEASAKRQVLDQIIEELTVHAEIEEQLLYPAAQSEVGDTGELVSESVEEHHVVETLIEELKGMDASDEQFEAKVTVLKENVEHHVEEEEQELFPKLRRSLDQERLNRLGEDLQRAKQEQRGDL